MKNKNLLIRISALFLISIFIFPAASCRTSGLDSQDITDTEETGITEEGDVQQEETGEDQAIEEITEINLWESDLVPQYILVQIKNELYKFFDSITVVEIKDDADVWIEIDDKLEDSSTENIKIVTEAEFQSSIENNNSFSIIPFDAIEKKYKVLNLDGLSVFDKELDTAGYGLTLGINVGTSNPEFENQIAGSLAGITITNRDVDKMASVLMTGVTALARGKTIGRRMDELGVLYPAEKIVDVLLDADITHISNEICFVEGCSSENRFPLLCSAPEYIELLKYVGTDVIELTGNHMNDYGPEWMLYTLDIYDNLGWPYFGGGRKLEDSYKPVFF